MNLFIRRSKMKRLPTVWVKIFAPGIGDLVVLGPVLYNLKAKNIVENINLIVYNTAQFSLACRMGWIDNVVIGFEKQHIPDGHFYVDMSEHPLEKIWWGSPEYIEKYGKTHAIKMMDKIIGGMGIPKELPPLHVDKNPVYKILSNTVLLSVGGRRRTKLLPLSHWLEINEILKEKGYQTALVGKREHQGSEQIKELEKTIPFLETNRFGEVIDIIYHAKGMISIDNGLYHISSYMDKPTVGVFGPMPPWLWGGLGKKTVDIYKETEINYTTAPLDWELINNPSMNYNPKNIVDAFLRLVVND